MVDLTQLQRVKTETELQAEADRIEAIRYLTSTDWYVTRSVEINVPVPDEVKLLRARAREVLA